MKKFLSILLCGLLLLSALPAFAGETVAFTDSAGREVEVPAAIEHILPNGQLAQITLLALAPEAMIGLSVAWPAQASAFLGEAYDLPILGQYYGGGSQNLEEVVSLDPQVIIDIGEMKKSMVEDMDGLQAQVDIPVVHIDAYMDSFGDCYRTLGGLLGLEDRAAVLADYCDRVYARTQEIMQKVGEDRVQMLYLLGEDGLSVIARGSYHGEMLDMICDNLAVVEEPSSRGTGNAVDMEQLLLWNPEYIVFAPDSAYAQVAGDALWQEMDAIANGNYIETPSAPFNWMGFPPSVQRYLGMLWLCDVFYPEQSGYDLYDEVAEYFSLFYHHELTQEEFDALMVNSLL